MAVKSSARANTAISVVVPVYNSELTLADLVTRLDRVLPSLSQNHEIILVNDGSRDSSWEKIEQLVQTSPQVRGINLRRNYGQHNALLCGIRTASYPITITMDDDLQHPPEEIPLLLKKLDEGFDVVYGVPLTMPHSFWRNLFSRFTKVAMAQAMGIRNIQNISAFRALRTDLRQAFADFKSPYLLLDVLLSWGTTRFGSVSVHLEARPSGKSNYDFFKLFNQAMLMLTGFSTAPLRLASLVGFGLTLFGILILFYVVLRFALEQGSVPGFPFLASIIAIFAGAQLFALGLIGEYLARVFSRSTDRPTYIVAEMICSSSSGENTL